MRIIIWEFSIFTNFFRGSSLTSAPIHFPLLFSLLPDLQTWYQNYMGWIPLWSCEFVRQASHLFILLLWVSPLLDLTWENCEMRLSREEYHWESSIVLPSHHLIYHLHIEWSREYQSVNYTEQWMHNQIGILS